LATRTKIEHLDVGDRWTPTAVWKVRNVLTDPSQIVVKQLDPTGTVTTVTTSSSPSTLTSASQPLARIDTGSFQLIPGIQLTGAGYWKARFEGTGAAEAAEDFTCVADPSEFVTGGAGLSSRALVTLSEAHDWLNEQTNFTGEDLEIARAINDMSDSFHYESGREFKVNGTNPQARSFFVDQRTPLVKIDDASTVSAVKLISQTDWSTVLYTYSSSEYVLEPESKNASAPYTGIRFRPSTLSPWPGQRVEVTGSYGWPSIPGRVRQAVLEAVADLLDRDVEHYRQDESATNTGDTTAVPSRFYQFLPLPPRALSVARSYQGVSVG